MGASDKLFEVGTRWLHENPKGDRYAAWPEILADVLIGSPDNLQLQDKAWNWLEKATTLAMLATACSRSSVAIARSRAV
jgi:hypothetical protein